MKVCNYFQRKLLFDKGINVSYDVGENGWRELGFLHKNNAEAFWINVRFLRIELDVWWVHSWKQYQKNERVREERHKLKVSCSHRPRLSTLRRMFNASVWVYANPGVKHPVWVDDDFTWLSCSDESWNFMRWLETAEGKAWCLKAKGGVK